MSRVIDTFENLYRRAQGDTLRRHTLAQIGRMAIPIMRQQIGPKIKKQYGFELDVTGQENIPQGRTVFVAPHQTYEDIEVCMAAYGEFCNPFVAIDGGADEAQWRQLELLDVTGTLRGTHPLAKKRQAEAKREEIAKLKAEYKQMVWPEGTYCPDFNGLLGFWKGGSVEAADESDSPIVPIMLTYALNSEATITECHVHFGESFDYRQYSDSIQAANGLRLRMLEMKIEMNAAHNPKVDQALYSKFRAAQVVRFPTDHEYRDGARYSLDYKTDPTAVETRFRDQ